MGSGEGVRNGRRAGEVERDTRTGSKIRFLVFFVDLDLDLEFPMLFYLHNQSNTNFTHIFADVPSFLPTDNKSDAKAH